MPAHGVRVQAYPLCQLAGVERLARQGKRLEDPRPARLGERAMSAVLP